MKPLVVLRKNVNTNSLHLSIAIRLFYLINPLIIDLSLYVEKDSKKKVFYIKKPLRFCRFSVSISPLFQKENMIFLFKNVDNFDFIFSKNNFFRF